MLKLSLIFLAFIALFVLLLRVAVILMGRITGKYVGEKHNSARARNEDSSRFKANNTQAKKCST